jgi:hypothetical protein
MFRAIVQKQILPVTVNRRKRSFWKVHTWRGPPEVYAILFTGEKVFQSLLETMIMYLMRTRV